MITSDCRCDKEIKRRIALAKKAFMEKKSLLVSNKLRMNCKLRFLKCYVQSVLLYGCESWTISDINKKRLEAAEMWFLRRMMRISWVKKMTNERVMELANTKRNLLTTIRKRQIEFIGHIVRKKRN